MAPSYMVTCGTFQETIDPSAFEGGSFVRSALTACGPGGSGSSIDTKITFQYTMAIKLRGTFFIKKTVNHCDCHLQR